MGRTRRNIIIVIIITIMSVTKTIILVVVGTINALAACETRKETREDELR